MNRLRNKAIFAGKFVALRKSLYLCTHERKVGYI